MREDKRILLSVIRVDESFSHGLEFVLVVCLGIRLVFRLRSIETNREKLAFVKRRLFMFFQVLNMSEKEEKFTYTELARPEVPFWRSWNASSKRDLMLALDMRRVFCDTIIL